MAPQVLDIVEPLRAVGTLVGSLGGVADMVKMLEVNLHPTNGVELLVAVIDWTSNNELVSNPQVVTQRFLGHKDLVAVLAGKLRGVDGKLHRGRHLHATQIQTELALE